jgi:3-oxoacyl-[acyl-carrier protein] reductase
MNTQRVVEIEHANAEAAGKDVATVRAETLRTIPAGRYGTPEEFANAVVFLCGAGASYITGTRLRVDGGLIAAH